jgi:hypothetical protein
MLPLPRVVREYGSMGVRERGGGGAEEQRSRGAEEQRSRGAEEQRSRGVEERGSEGAEEQLALFAAETGSLSPTLPLSHSPGGASMITDAATLAEVGRQLAASPMIAFDTETTGTDPQAAELVGLALAWEQGSGGRGQEAGVRGQEAGR